MADAIFIGELLIDFVPVTTGTDLTTATAFHKAAGGAPANVAVRLARLGVSSALMGKAGEDGFGRFLVRAMRSRRVGHCQLLFEKDHPQALRSTSLLQAGEIPILVLHHFGQQRQPHTDDSTVLLQLVHALVEKGLLPWGHLSFVW